MKPEALIFGIPTKHDESGVMSLEKVREHLWRMHTEGTHHWVDVNIRAQEGCALNWSSRFPVNVMGVNASQVTVRIIRHGKEYATRCGAWDAAWVKHVNSILNLNETTEASFHDDARNIHIQAVADLIRYQGPWMVLGIVTGPKLPHPVITWVPFRPLRSFFTRPVESRAPHGTMR
jgi:hypothetical protein